MLHFGSLFTLQQLIVLLLLNLIDCCVLLSVYLPCVVITVVGEYIYIYIYINLEDPRYCVRLGHWPVMVPCMHLAAASKPRSTMMFPDIDVRGSYPGAYLITSGDFWKCGEGGVPVTGLSADRSSGSLAGPEDEEQGRALGGPPPRAFRNPGIFCIHCLLYRVDLVVSGCC